MNHPKFNELIIKINELEKLMPLSIENEAKLWRKLKLEWNYHSNHIEGNTLTYGETINLLERGIATEKSFRDNLEIKAHDLAIEELREEIKYLLSNPEHINPLSHKFIRNLNKTILKEPFYKRSLGAHGEIINKLIVPGEYKKSPNSVRLSDGSIFEYAPPEQVHHLMTDLIDEINQFLTTCRTEKNNNYKIEKILQNISDFHHKFTLIHPFDDGNGRTSRLITNFLFMYLKLPPIIIHSDYKDRYLNALNHADTHKKAKEEHLSKLVDLFGDALISSLNLNLKAAQGLSLEEDDDLDKEINILKKNLRALEKNRSPLDRESISDVNSLMEINESLANLFNEFIKTMRKFEDLFTEISFNTRKEPLSDLDIFNLMDNFYKEGLGSMPEISCTLKKYKNSLKEDLNIASYLSVNFYQLEYEISSNYLERSMYKSYNTVLLNLEIKNICKEISRKVLAEIAGFKNIL
jgi:Fic family protein